jgi:hypothetical protein
MLYAALALQRASIALQLAAVFAGGPAPMIVTAILAATGSGQMIALYYCAAAASGWVPAAAGWCALRNARTWRSASWICSGFAFHG